MFWGYGPEDPVGLVESCYRSVKWLLATRTAKGLMIPKPWINHPYGEEQLALLEEELLPAMAGFLARWIVLRPLIASMATLALNSGL
jgi:hypothetical protein